MATSATIGAGDEAARKQLEDFLSSLAGVSSDRVTVVYGERAIPELGSGVDVEAVGQTIEELQAMSDDPEGLYKRLTVHPVARRLRALFVPAQSGQGFQPLSTMKQVLKSVGFAAGQTETLRWLDALTRAVAGEGRTAQQFLPLRLHVFHNTLNGLWACAHDGCSEKRSTEVGRP